MKRKKGERVFDITVTVLLVFMGIITLYPIWYVIIASVSDPTAISAGEVLLLPKGINFSAYELLMEKKEIWIGYRNSILYTTAATLLGLVVTIPLSYALSRRTLPGRRWIMFLFTFTMYFSGGIIPAYILMSNIGFVNSPLALIVPGCVNIYNMIVARSFFESNVPESLYDAARIDGASYTRFFIQVVLPLSKAVLAIIALFYITSNWNAYLNPQIYIYDPALKTLQQIIRMITASLDTSLLEGITMEEMIERTRQTQLLKYAVVVVSSLPLVLIYPFVQKYFVKGVMIGAVKG